MARVVKRRRSLPQQEPEPTTIYDIPEAIICMIISLLPLKYAIRTGSVMRNWRNLWNRKTDWELDSSIFSGSRNRQAKFEDLVDYIIYFHKGPGIRSLKLSDGYHKQKNQRAVRWIDYVVHNGIRKLEIDFYPSICPPLSLFTSDKLEEMRLCLNNLFLSLPPIVTLSNLKDMFLERVRFSNSNTFQKLLDGCPRLMKLHMKECFPLRDKMIDFYIHHPTLKHFIFENHYFINQTILHITTPGLSSFEFKGTGLLHRDHIFHDMTSVNEAVFGVEGTSVDYGKWITQGRPGDRGLRMVRLLLALPNASIISLTDLCMEYLSVIAITQQPLFTARQKLESVHLKMWPTREHAFTVIRLIERCPKLHSLFITVTDWHRIDLLIEDGPDFSELLHLLAMGTHHFYLKRVQIKDFQGSEDEINLVKFILTNAQVLEKMEIFTSKEKFLITLRIIHHQLRPHPKASVVDLKLK